MTTTTTPLLMPMAEAVKFTGLSERTMWRLVRDREVPRLARIAIEFVIVLPRRQQVIEKGAVGGGRKVGRNVARLQFCNANQ